MHTHHSHSGSFCCHAKDTIDAILERFQQLGFYTVGLSEHCPRQHPTSLYPEEHELGVTPCTLKQTFKTYVQRAHELREQYAGTMELLVGAETENLGATHSDSLAFLLAELERLPGAAACPVRPEAGVPIGALVGKGAIEYLVGSVHHVHGIPIDFDPPTFDKAVALYEAPGVNPALAHAKLMLDYFDAQYDVLRTLRPEVVGHMDLCRLYRPGTPLQPNSQSKDGQLQSTLTSVWDKVQRNVRYAASYGALFEINSSASRKGWTTAYPQPELLGLIASVGGRVCLSDDSHGVVQVGLNYGRLRTYLLDQGINRIWFLARPEQLEQDYANHEEEAVQGRAQGTGTIQAPTRFPRGLEARPLSNWFNDPFWTQGLPSTPAQ